MKNYLTFKVLDYQVMKRLKLAVNDIPLTARQSYVNNALMKLYALLEGLNDPFYNFTTTLTVAADLELLKDNSMSGGTIDLLNATSNTIRRTSGTFVAGSIVAITIGGVTPEPYVTNQALVRIATGGATATFTIISGTVATFVPTTNSVSAVVLKTLSSTTVDLSAMYVKEVRRVWDGSAGSERIFHLLTDGRRFADLQNDPDFAAEVAAYHRGDTLELKKGSSAAALGTVQMEYRGKPNTYTDATAANEVLLPPEYNEMLMDEVQASYAMHAGLAIDDQLQKRLANYSKMYEADAAEAARTQGAKAPGVK